MRCLFVLCSVMLVFFSVGAASAAPTLAVEQLNHDFGDIIQGAKVEYSFRFHNAGDQVLEIGQLRSSCGCTAALLSASRVAPGMLGELRVTFNSQGFRGQVQKMVTFETNDPKHQEVTFSLRGQVKAELYFNPERINWGRVANGALLTQEVEIVNDSPEMVILQQPEVTSPELQTELLSTHIAAGQSAKLKITVEFPKELKRLAGYVIVRSNFPSVPQLKLPVSARLSAN